MLQCTHKGREVRMAARSMLAGVLVVAVVLVASTQGRYADVGLRRGLFFSLAPAEDLNASPGDAVGERLNLSKYLDDPVGAQTLSKVTLGPRASYAGFLNVNNTSDNNLFMWYFPAATNKPAPLLIWLQGGPGGSSMFGLFSEVGPYTVSATGQIAVNPLSWNNEYAMLFIDNPVGAGFSYTGTGQGYASDQSDVARDLISGMAQFYTLFPQQQQQPLYITGESFAGHYIPAFGAAILQYNKAATTKIPLAGVSIGDGWTDPVQQLRGYSDLMFNLGLADAEQKKVIETYCLKAIALIEVGKLAEAFESWDAMLNGDIYPYPNYFHNITGSDDYDNFMRTEAPASFGYYAPFLNTPATRAAIHVGNATFNNGHECEMHLVADVMRSYKADLATLMAAPNMKVLLYNGQLDLIVGVPLTELYIPTISWPGRSAWEQAPRSIWKVLANDTEIAGFVKTSGDFTQIVVRGAGHIVPFDQPRRSLDMITRFVEGKPWTA